MKKQIFKAIAVCGLFLFLSSILDSCNQEEIFAKATIETNQITSVTEATANCGGIITGDGGSNVTSRGVCWSTSPNPSLENDTTLDAAGTGQFTSKLKGLLPGTIYYVRAYAVNKGGVTYGLQVVFTTKTLSIFTTPVAISLITATSAIGGGSIISDGDSSFLTVKARGVCWNKYPSPTIENSKTLDGVGGGRFISTIDSLTAFTTYYVRAYMTNSVGTKYGNEVSFTTQSGIINLTTLNISAITPFTATFGGRIDTDGGAPVTVRGVCWSTTPNPTTANKRTDNGSGTGPFTTNITGLLPSTTYFVRSYATNSVGTNYGNEVSFTTKSGVIVLTTNTTSLITAYTAACSGTISSDGGDIVTERGICWDTNSNPSISSNKMDNGSGIGTFKSYFTGLIPGTTYYVCTYATNSVGTSYGNVLSFTTSTENTVTDIDGNLYHTIKIGNQTWMIENLRTTKYRNGELIGTTTPATKDISIEVTPKYQWPYNGNEGNVAKYGRLYTWYAAKDNRNIAPTDWHLPSDAEWTTLENFLIANGYNYDGTITDNYIAKSLAATSGWPSYTYTGAIGNNLTKNNTSGFSALPGGRRFCTGSFYDVGDFGNWWTSTQYNTPYAWYRNLGAGNWFIYSGTNYNKQDGLSVRCVRDY